MRDAKKIFADNLRLIMKNNSLSERDMYNLFYITPAMQNLIFTMIDVPSISTVQRVADFAGVSVYDLFHKELSKVQVQTND